MQKIKNKTFAILIAAILTISMGASIILLPNADAHTPPWSLPTYAFINIAPAPIGVGQTVNVNLWLQVPAPTALLKHWAPSHQMIQAEHPLDIRLAKLATTLSSCSLLEKH